MTTTIALGGHSFTTIDMVRHVTRTDRRYNESADAARKGKRTLEAIAGGQELLDDDLRLLAVVLQKPSNGWVNAKVTVETTKPDGSKQEQLRHVTFPAVDFLPLLDPIHEAAAKLPPLPAK